jgi:AraC family transcriptional regulator
VTEAAAEDYRRRFRRVLEYIDTYLDGDVSVERLSAVAAFSKYHFHRQFSHLFGIGVYRYVLLVRLKRAAYQLAFRHQERIIDVALGAGYESHEAFSRAFKKVVGQTPSEFRERPAWAPWRAVFQPLSELRSEHMKPDNRSQQVNVVEFKATRVGVLEHHGDPARIEETIGRFIEWRKQNRLHPRVSATFNLFYGDLDTPPEEFRLDLCAATDKPIGENPFGVVERTIPGGRCAVLRHIGSDDTLVDTIKYLYGTWLPASGEELRDFPLFAQRVSMFPDVPEHEAETDVFLPLR